MAYLKSIDTLLNQAVASKAMPGVVAAAATEKGLLYEGAFGRREIGKDAVMTRDTVVWIASMTKAIDRARRVCGVFLSQVFPFFDRTAIDLFAKFETEVYRAA